MAHLNHTVSDVSSVSDIYRTDKNRIKKLLVSGELFYEFIAKSTFSQEDVSDYNQSE
jgi:hypothetical protein